MHMWTTQTRENAGVRKGSTWHLGALGASQNPLKTVRIVCGPGLKVAASLESWWTQ